MTRINVVPVTELTDQHLFAEWREIKHVPKALRRSLKAHGPDALKRLIPAEYCLGKGHVMFFMNKTIWLTMRHIELRAELTRRRMNFTDAPLDADGIILSLPPSWYNMYVPTPAALALNRARIAERISARPGWYRMNGEII